MEKYLYGEMTWPEIGNAAKESRVALLPVGMVEDHGLHLPVDADIRIAWEICHRAGAIVPHDVVVVPPVVHGYSPHHMDFPGVLSISQETFTNYVLDICRSLVHHGFTRILVANAHGSNAHLLESAVRLTVIDSAGEALCHSVSVYESKHYIETAKQILEESPDEGGHADEAETSMCLAINPACVDMARAVRETKSKEVRLESVHGAASLLVPYWSTHTRSGIMGDPTRASKEKGAKLLEAAAKGLAAIIREFRAREIGPRIDHH